MDQHHLSLTPSSTPVNMANAPYNVHVISVQVMNHVINTVQSLRLKNVITSVLSTSVNWIERTQKTIHSLFGSIHKIRMKT